MSEEYDTSADMGEPVTAISIEAPKKKREGVKMTEKQKDDLRKHMAKHKKDGMSVSEMRSVRMKLMGRMRKDPKMTANKAMKLISQ